MQITIYSTTTCPYCKMLKDYLGERGLAFMEKLVDQDDTAKNEMMQAFRARSVRNASLLTGSGT